MSNGLRDELRLHFEAIAHADTRAEPCYPHIWAHIGSHTWRCPLTAG
jgi:hypothetical protein